MIERLITAERENDMETLASFYVIFRYIGKLL
jgi:hypothetical protein